MLRCRGKGRLALVLESAFPVMVKKAYWTAIWYRIAFSRQVMAETVRASFPTTDWGLLANVRSATPIAKQAALDILTRRYWRPVFGFLRFSGNNEESAKDLTQAFFADWIENDVFGKADERQGRFRSFMLTCLKRFVSNEHRAENAQKRKPVAGLLSTWA